MDEQPQPAHLVAGDQGVDRGEQQVPGGGLHGVVGVGVRAAGVGGDAPPAGGDHLGQRGEPLAVGDDARVGAPPPLDYLLRYIFGDAGLAGQGAGTAAVDGAEGGPLGDAPLLIGERFAVHELGGGVVDVRAGHDDLLEGRVIGQGGGDPDFYLGE